jgi:hypothetical protein
LSWLPCWPGAFITTATFGAPLDITPAELVIESPFPADPATARAMTDHAHLFPSSTWPL